ncbi:MAG: glycosyltransferase family A protein [Candidatus Nitrosocosmicus sp.]
MEIENNRKYYGAFIIPHSDNNNQNNNNQTYVEETIEGLFSQTEDEWCAIIIVNKSTGKKAIDYLKLLKEEHYPKIDVIFLEYDVGPGVCRNLGILKALEKKSSIILFNDSDDISHPKRLETTKKIFLTNSEIGLIYSTFKVIDENNRLVPIEKIPSATLEILESHRQNHLEGDNVWIKMGTQTGYTNLTSSTSVRIEFAYQCPFPNEQASEDFHTWMRVSAMGARFKYIDSIPSKYRIPIHMQNQSSRMRIGLNKFNQTKVRVDADGFSKAIEIAVVKGIIKPEDIPLLKLKFYKRLAKTMKRQDERELVEEILDLSKQQEIEHLIYLNK